MAISLHFGPQLARAIALDVVYKHLVNSGLLDRFWSHPALLLVPGVVSVGRDLQHLAELAHGHPGPALGDVVVGAHGVGWPKVTKAFFKISSFCASRLLAARRARASGSRATSTLPTSATSRACYQR